MSALGLHAGRIWRLLNAALLALAWISCESGNGGPELGGETNWLAWCQSDAECASGTCVCGVCTASCSTELPSCAAAPGESSCFAHGSFAHSALCAQSSVEGICLPACATDGDCGERSVCRLGACSPPNSLDESTGVAAPSADEARLSALAEFSDGWGPGLGEPLTLEGDLPCGDDALACPTLEALLSNDSCYNVSHGCGLYYVTSSQRGSSDGYWYDAFGAPPVAAFVTNPESGNRALLGSRSVECDAIEVVCSTCGGDDEARCAEIPGAFPQPPLPAPVPGCSCEPDGENAARVSLDCFCSVHDCPSSPAAVVEACLTDAAAYQRAVTDECGRVWFEQGSSNSLRFAFDAATRELVAAIASSGAPISAPCNTLEVRAGANAECETDSFCLCGESSSPCDPSMWPSLR